MQSRGVSQVWRCGDLAYQSVFEEDQQRDDDHHGARRWSELGDAALWRWQRSEGAAREPFGSRVDGSIDSFGDGALTLP